MKVLRCLFCNFFYLIKAVDAIAIDDTALGGG